MPSCVCPVRARVVGRRRPQPPARPGGHGRQAQSRHRGAAHRIRRLPRRRGARRRGRLARGGRVRALRRSSPRCGSPARAATGDGRHRNGRRIRARRRVVSDPGPTRPPVVRGRPRPCNCCCADPLRSSSMPAPSTCCRERHPWSRPRTNANSSACGRARSCPSSGRPRCRTPRPRVRRAGDRERPRRHGAAEGRHHARRRPRRRSRARRAPARHRHQAARDAGTGDVLGGVIGALVAADRAAGAASSLAELAAAAARLPAPPGGSPHTCARVPRDVPSSRWTWRRRCPPPSARRDRP